MDDKLTLTLSVQQWNTIMGLLGQQPYVAVQPLINEIQQQVAARNAMQHSAMAQENRDAIHSHTVTDHPHSHSFVVPTPNGHDGPGDLLP